ncbi:hypothetical protein [Rufibacter roseus]|uniref:Uncharacterized protein n=1 Tax=Rufibacter roseus TaxID=1567108 RepID=A0ABW2DM21_9BACT|nr:hypothetical protein [Rufibacter roseus]
MKQFLRSLFGLKEVTIKRTGAGTGPAVGELEVAYIKSSNKRLAVLQTLSEKYQNTAHASKMQAVYEKTKNIHSYLVGRRLAHELELFHLQNTDHFIKTFTVILEVHQKHQHLASPPPLPELEAKPRVKRVEKSLQLPEMIKPISTQGQSAHPLGARTPVPRLQVPDISLNTFERISYLHENAVGKLVVHQVGFTSSPEEKNTFLAHITSRLGLEEISYVGNAHVTIPNQNGVTPTGIVPIIHWEGFLYAINLNDYRLFPVRIYRKGM